MALIAEEKKELDEKINKHAVALAEAELRQIRDDTDGLEVSAGAFKKHLEVKFLREQLDIMLQYSAILNKRIVTLG